MITTELFSRLAKDHMTTDIVTLDESATCQETVTKMAEDQASSAILQDDSGIVTGIVTEQDVTRRMAFVVDPRTPVREIMNSPVHTIQGDDYLFHGLARMCRNRLRHMPVIDPAGRAVGILQLHNALAVACDQMMTHVDRLTRANTLEGMAEVKAVQVVVANDLFSSGAQAAEVQALLAGINNDIYHHVIELSLEEMAADDWGDPPVPFEVLVMGSGGRGESFLGPDQDNGFILADYPDAEHSRVDSWFVELAERMTTALDTIGFDLCSGHVMATNPLWRKTLSQWKRQVAYWVDRPRPQTLRLCDIFFDFACVYGAGTMTADLRKAVTTMVRHRGFLGALCQADQSHDVGLTWFGRLQTDPTAGPNKGKVNLKLTGTLPLVGATRLMALREGIDQSGTLNRLQQLHDRELLSQNEHEGLTGAYRVITGLLLRQQLRDYGDQKRVGKHLPPENLSRRDRELLADGFRAIRTFRSRVRSEFTGTLLG